MKNRLATVFASVFVLLLLALLVAFNHQKPRVLILHSFSESGQWETAVNTGIQRELARNREPIAVRWRYMALSPHMNAKQWAAAAQRSRATIDSWRPDVLVAIGEEAQDYVGRHYAGRPGPRLVYAMGEDPASFGYAGAPNVTGVHEALPLAQIVELLRHLDRPPPREGLSPQDGASPQDRPPPRDRPSLRIRALGIDDPTGHAERQQVQDFDWGPHRLLGVELVPDFQAWQEAVRAAAQDADVLLVLSFGGLPKAPGDPGEADGLLVAGWTEHESRPLAIGVRESFVAGGGALAVVPSPYGLGEQAAREALATLAAIRHGEPPPAPEDSLDFQIALRPGRLAARGVELPAIYVQAARATQSLYGTPLDGKPPHTR